MTAQLASVMVSKMVVPSYKSDLMKFQSVEAPPQTRCIANTGRRITPDLVEMKVATASIPRLRVWAVLVAAEGNALPATKQSGISRVFGTKE